jgi:hypothetical protein
MAKLITWLDLEGRYRVTSPAYNDRLRPAGETEEACLDRTWARLVAVGGYGIAIDHAHSYVEDDVLKAKEATLGGLSFRYRGKPDGMGQRDGKNGAWEMDSDGTPKVNMDKARVVQMDRIRIMRDKELAKKDIDMLRAIESGDSSAQSTVAADKQTLRDIPASFDLTTGVDTPVQLKAKWPDGLPTE